MKLKVGDKVKTKDGRKAKITGISATFYHITCKDGEKIICGESQIKPRFPWKKFRNGKFAVHCKTEKEARDFLKRAKKHGLLWSSGKTLKKSDTNWMHYRENSLYDCEWDIKESGIPARICFSGLQEANKKDRKKVEWSDYMKPELHQTDSEPAEKITLTCAADIEERNFGLEYLKRLKAGGYNWIARDGDDDVYAYKAKPKKEVYEGNNIALWGEEVNPQSLKIGSCHIQFPEIRWEDSEPTLINDLIVKHREG